MIEKTPKNSLRVPFLRAIFGDALFVFLYRDWRRTLASMVEAWTSGRFVTYPRLPGWPPPAWSLLLVPGWESLRGRPLFEVVALQWATALDLLLDALDTIDARGVIALDYAALLAAPDETMRALSTATDLGWDRTLGDSLPLSPTTMSAPAPEKWRRFETEIAAVEPLVARTDARARAFLAAYQITR